MAEEDEEETTFITSQGIFCYAKMPFGLKNAGATYQRLVDRAFQKQIGRNLEVYVDDLVIKSHTEEEIIRDIAETFKTLRQINMKLNPKKCTFGMQEGMFLGYKVNAEGLKVCPDKADAVLSLPSPGCLKDVQKLNGKLASLNRFLSKSAEKSLPFFKTLKKCTKKGDFQWTQEAEVAFKQMKKLIAELPILTAPKEKEELIMSIGSYDSKGVKLGRNKKADALSKIASTSFAHLSKQVLVEELKEKSIHEKEVLAIVEEEEQTWMTPICEYLTKEHSSETKRESHGWYVAQGIVSCSSASYAVTIPLCTLTSDREILQPVDPPSLTYVPGPVAPNIPDFVHRMRHPWRTASYPWICFTRSISLGVEMIYASGDDTDDDDEEPFEDEEDDEEEEEHLAPADSSAIPVVDPVPSAGDTKAFETDESAPTPRPPQIRIPFAQTRLPCCRTLHYPLPVASSPLPLPSPLTTSPTDAGAPLGYRAAGIRMRATVAPPPSSLPPTSPRTDVPEAEMPPRKRACLTTPAPRYEIGESSAAGAARQPGPTPEVDTWDEIVEAMMEIASTTLEGVDQRVTELDTTSTHYTEIDHTTATQLWLWIERRYARIAWTSSEERSAAIEAHVRTLEALVATIDDSDLLLRLGLNSALGRIATLEARDPEPQDGPAEAGSSRPSCFDYDVLCMNVDLFMSLLIFTSVVYFTALLLLWQNADASRCIEDGVKAMVQERWKKSSAATQRRMHLTVFLKCQPINFKGTEGVVGLTQWAEKMESVFLISNCAITNQVKFALYSSRKVPCVVATPHKFALGARDQKLESEYWNLKVRGTDLMTYNQRFQELALMCDRMFPEGIEQLSGQGMSVVFPT
ncbi:reverse transcriptase domain-containing protein [Tanacetum coccineum]